MTEEDEAELATIRRHMPVDDPIHQADVAELSVRRLSTVVSFVFADTGYTVGPPEQPGAEPGSTALRYRV
ncbi:MAG TPA: hypothetical protein VK988_20555, partial [Acidimicrobiales bacterium]|nr:hypothetical protein [Acidimicrobiales bacterium]